MRSDHLSDAELQLVVDRERDLKPDAARHLAACDACRARRDAFGHLIRESLAALRDGQPADPALARSRGVLLAAIAATARRPTRPFPFRARPWTSAVARWSTAAVAVFAVLLALRGLETLIAPTSTGAADLGALPIAALTPGATSSLTAADLCGGRPADPPAADPAVRAQVLRSYGMTEVPAREYELDYLITPALGGANDPKNLWPERYTDRTWNARVKDQLEDLLPALVCGGQLDLRTAQRDIAADWVAADKKYFKTDTPLDDRN